MIITGRWLVAPYQILRKSEMFKTTNEKYTNIHYIMKGRVYNNDSLWMDVNGSADSE